MAETNKFKTINAEAAEKEFNIEQPAYLKRGGTGFYNDITWRPNTELALFNNSRWETEGAGTPDFSLSDYTWYPEFCTDVDSDTDISHYISTFIPGNASCVNMYERLVKRTPTIRIRAFKPNLSELGSLIALFSLMYKVGNVLFDVKSKALKEAIKSAFKVENIAEQVKKATEGTCFMSSVDSKHGLFSLFYNAVNAFYRRLVAGVYMTSYTMPFYNSNLYLKSNSGTWGINTLLGNFSVLESYIGSTDIMTTAKWDSKGSTGVNGTTGYDAINFEFSIFNRTSEDVYKNLRFIHTLIPEALWLQNGLFQVPGTLYDVEIPGRTRFYWCTAEFKCEYQGKTRYFTSYNIADLYTTPKLTSAFETTRYSQNARIKQLRKEIEKLEKNEAQVREEIVSEKRKALLAGEKIVTLDPNNPDNDVYAPITEDDITDIDSAWKTYANPEPGHKALGKVPDDMIAGVDEKSKVASKYREQIKTLQDQIRAAENAIKNADDDRYMHANISSYKFTKQKIRDLNLIPDAYKINCTLNSLLPNNLNTYLYGLFENDSETTPKYGEGTDKVLHSFIRTFTTNLITNGFSNALQTEKMKNPQTDQDRETKASLEKALNELKDL